MNPHKLLQKALDSPSNLHFGEACALARAFGFHLSRVKGSHHNLCAIYPPPPYLAKIIEENGRQVLAVIVWSSELRPHFAGRSYIRKGSETFEASEEQFAELIARRNSKANMILRFKEKEVSVVNYGGTSVPEAMLVAECNQFWVTIAPLQGGRRVSYPLSRVKINFDDERNRLKLEINRIH